MKLTLAFGLQYDQTPASAADPAAPLKVQGGIEAPAEQAVIDVVVEALDVSELEFNYRHGIFFLTYNVEGGPDPFIQESENIDLFV